MKKFFGMWDSFVNALQPAGDWVAILPIRLLMAYEFGKSGFTKYGASGVPGWFENLQDKFLFPFSVIPPEVSWFLATWTEIIGGICLFFDRVLQASGRQGRFSRTQSRYGEPVERDRRKCG